MTHELEWLTYFYKIAEGTRMPDADFLIVWEGFLKTIIIDGKCRLRMI